MNKDFDKELEKLVEAWCDRREYRVLAVILQTYPRVSGLTDEWGDLAASLKLIRERYPKRLVSGELSTVIELQLMAEAVLKR